MTFRGVEAMVKAKKARRRGLHLLTPLGVKNARVGVHSDGSGLVLVVDKSDSGTIRRRWIFRFHSPTHGRKLSDGTIAKRRREMGLGSAATISLKAVRDLAQRYRDEVKSGVDPIDKRQEVEGGARVASIAAREAARAERESERHTLRRTVRDYHERNVEPKRSDKDSKLWLNAIEQHVSEKLLDRPIAELSATDLLNPLAAKIRELPETGRRIVQRLGLVFAEAKVKGLVASNLIGDIRPLLRVPKKELAKARTNFASLPYADVPAFAAALRTAPGTAALALEFLIRCAARTGEVLGATWDEMNLKAGVWTVPAKRMKAGEQHQVFLPPRAVAILEAARALGGAYCFPSPMDAKRPLSNMAMAALIDRMNEATGKPRWVDPKLGRPATVHGFRSSFSAWAYEVAQRSKPELARPDVVEACLAHRESNLVKASYNRAGFDADRRELLALWSTFIDSKPGALLDFEQAQAKKAKAKKASSRPKPALQLVAERPCAARFARAVTPN